jgi:hypothetical protein
MLGSSLLERDHAVRRTESSVSLSAVTSKDLDALVANPTD